MFALQVFKLLIKPRALITSFSGIITIIIIGIHTNYINEKHIKSIGLKKDYEDIVIDYYYKIGNFTGIMEVAVLDFVHDVFKRDTADKIRNKVDVLKNSEGDNQVLKEIVDKFNAQEK